MTDVAPDEDWEPFHGDEETVAGMEVVALYVKDGGYTYEYVEAPDRDHLQFNAYDWLLVLRDGKGGLWTLKWKGDHPVIGGKGLNEIPDEDIPPDFLEERGVYEEGYWDA